ncbi:MAG: hypothetical protein ACTSQE_15910 [Candidatus Heimdallarchaeaceae archaeon]
MKQHITKEQWDELKYKEQQQLVGKGEVVKEKDIYWLRFNIGQMIEFLGDEWWKGLFDLIAEQKKNGLEYRIITRYTNICDALWEAVKEKLK